MKFKWLAILVVFSGCKPSPEPPKAPEVQHPSAIAWTAAFADAPFKNPDILNFGEVLALSPAEIVDRHIARLNSDWIYDFDLVNGGPAKPVTPVGPVNGQIFIVANDSFTALRVDGKVTIFDQSGQSVTEFDAPSVAWARGATEQPAMAWDKNVLWVLTSNAVLRWESGKPTTLLEHQHVIRRVAFLTGSISFEHDGGWTVVTPNGSTEVPGTGQFTFVGMNAKQNLLWRKSAEGVSFAKLDDAKKLDFVGAENLQDADSLFIRDDMTLAQWWPAEALWLSDYAQAAWIDGTEAGERFDWGASWPQTAHSQGTMSGLSSTPTALWTRNKTTQIELNSAASAALFFDGKTIVRRVGNLVQRLGIEQPSKVFSLRVIRQLMCSGETCLALGREGALDRIDLKTKTRQTILFIHTGETLPPLLSFTEKATVLCEPRCVTKTGEFVSGLVELDVQSGAITAQPTPEVLGKGVLAQRVFKHPSGVQVSISEMERAAHKLGRPPRFFQIDLDGFKDGNIAPSEWIISDKKDAYFATKSTLEGRGTKTFKVEVADAHNLIPLSTEAGERLMHLQGRGENTKLFVRNAESGDVISEVPAPNISAFSMVDGRIFYALEDGRLVLADL